jgi:hypothetical protein
MKINRMNSITCKLKNQGVKDFEEWGTAWGLNVNQAVKTCIAFTIANKPPQKASVGRQRAKTLEEV